MGARRGAGAHLYRGTTSRLSPSNVGRAGGNARRPAAWCMHAAASCAEPSSSTSVLWLDVMHCGQGWHTVRGALSPSPSHENQIPRSALNGTRSSACTPPAQAQHAQRTAHSTRHPQRPEAADCVCTCGGAGRRLISECALVKDVCRVGAAMPDQPRQMESGAAPASAVQEQRTRWLHKKGK